MKLDSSDRSDTKATRRESNSSTKKKLPSNQRNDSDKSGSSTGSSKSKRSALRRQGSLMLKEDRKPRRGMKKEESLRLKRLENNLSALFVDLSTKSGDDKPAKPAKRKDSPKSKSPKASKDNTDLDSYYDSDTSLSEGDLNDANDPLLSPIRKPRIKRGKSFGSAESINSSISSGISFLASIASDSDGSDQSIETVDDDDLFGLQDRSAESDDESDHEMQKEFYRYMKSQPTSCISGVKVYTVYHEKKTSRNGKMFANKDYVCAALVLGDRT